MGRKPKHVTALYHALIMPFQKRFVWYLELWPSPTGIDARFDLGICDNRSQCHDEITRARAEIIQQENL